MLITPILSFPIFSNVKSTWTGETPGSQKMCATVEQMFKEEGVGIYIYIPFFVLGEFSIAELLIRNGARPLMQLYVDTNALMYVFWTRHTQEDHNWCQR